MPLRLVLPSPLLAARGGLSEPVATRAALYPNETPELRALIEGYARAVYGVPTDLVQRVVVRESRHRARPRATAPTTG